MQNKIKIQSFIMDRVRYELCGLLFVTAAGACTGLVGDERDDEYDLAASEVAIAGAWNPPPNVRAAGAAQFVHYDGPPPWAGEANCSKRLLDGTRQLGDFIKAQFAGSVNSYGGYDCRANTANGAETSVHGTGRALDLFVTTIGGAADNTKGDAVANWLILHAQEIGVQYIIWDRAAWSGSHGGDKMGAYTGPDGHFNHLHIELTHDAAARRTPWFTGQGGPCTVQGAIAAKYNSLGGAGSFLGNCVTNETTTPDTIGRFNHFHGGSIYWTNATGAWSVRGEIRRLWENLGWELGGLGYPTSDETMTPDTVGRFNHFQGGSIYWTPQLGAHEVRGAIHEKWKATGWELGPLGYPISNETSTPDTIGRFNHFQFGSIYWTNATGAHEVHNLIRDKYKAMGWELSPLGYPTSDEKATPDGIGRFNHFQNGSIYWTPQLGAHEVHGAIHDKWKEFGWELGPLGYPTSDETNTPDTIGRFNHFQGGSIYWTNATGARAVYSAIRQRWADLGWELSPLGYPTSSEKDTACGGGRVSVFQRGNIYWTSTYGAHEVPGPVLTKYLAMQGECGSLGFPTSVPMPVAGGTRYPFEHGALVVNASGVVTVQ